MNQPRVRVSIVIPAYNEEHHLQACLQAIAAQTVLPHEIIVVDNNSKDRTVDIARTFPDVIVIAESRQGRHHARNAGFDMATGDILGRIDADIILPTDWVAHLTQFYSLSAHSRQAWSSAGIFYNVRLKRLVSFAFSLLAFRLNRLLLGYYALWGSSMAITHQQWQAVRGVVCDRLDIHEDLDLAMHVHQQGFGITYDTTMKVRAELRRVTQNRGQLWDYLNWWPRTLRIHGKRNWVVAWVFGVLLLYLATYLLVLADILTNFFGRPDKAEGIKSLD